MSAALDAFRLRHPLRVRWAEVDLQGVVFNGHYLTYCDVGATEYWRAIGLVYPKALHELGCDTFVRKATLEYIDAALFDDELLVCARVARLGRTSLRFDVQLVRAHDTSRALVTAELIYVNADLRTRKALPWPEVLRQKVLAFESVAPELASGAS